jgi:hypothetical protein
MKLTKPPRLLHLAAISLSLVSANLPAAPANPEDVFGIAHVDGKYFLTQEDFLNEGADQILATGSKVIKIYLSPKPYPWNSDWPASGSLVERAQQPCFKSVFAKPFHTFILTVYSIGRQEHYWTEGVTPEESADETRQFYELTKYLLATYKGTGKTFVLQHWEGDWALRRNSSVPYDKDYSASPTAVQGMIDWLNARQAGIVKARAEAGATDVHIYGATEVNRLQDSIAGKPGVANSVLPHTTVDLVSYSSYDSLDTPERLTQAVDYLASHLPPTAAFGQNPHSVYLGEFGYPENGQGGIDALNRRIDNVMSVVNTKELPWAIFWEIYCNEPLDKSAPLPLNGKQNDHNLRGFWMVKPDGSPSIAWQRYRRIFATTDANRATTRVIKSRLTQVFSENFNRADGKDLGPGWTQAAHYGLVNEQLAQHRLRMEIPSGKDIPWGSATLDLSNRDIVGHGLEVGDYFEITARRLSAEGGLGIELFDSDQLRVGSDLRNGPTELKAWNGTTWVPVAFDEHGKAVTFDWNKPHTIGVRFDSADGHHTTFSYYLDGHYAGSWLIATPNKTLDKIGVYTQTKTSGATFEFGDLKIFAARH